MVFRQGVTWLTPKGVTHPASLAPLEQYDALLEDALRRRELAETVLAQQVLFEGLGEAILSRLNTGMSNRGVGFSRLRRLLLHQECAHHDFGLRQLAQLTATDILAQDSRRRRQLFMDK